MKSLKPKIAIYSGEIPSTTFIERLINGVAKNGYRIYVFGNLKRKTVYTGNIHVVGYGQSKFSKAIHLLKYSILLFLFKNKAKQTLDIFIKKHSKNTIISKLKSYPVLWYQPDIFHIQWAKGIGDWMWLQQFGTKIIVSLRGVHINYSPITIPEVAAIYRHYFPKINAFHAVSKSIAVEAQKYGVSPEKIHVIYSGLLPLEVSSYKTENTLFKILSVGRPHWVKGYSYALDACHILKNLGINFQYSIIGGKESEELQFQISEELQFQIADLQLEKQVQLLGQLPFTEVQKHMLEADVVLLSSVEEGIANVVLEAMQLGTLVVSTQCGGMDEVITHAVNGFLVPIRDAEKMAQTLQHVISLSIEEKETITREAKKTIENQHTSSKMINDMVGMYQNVLDQ